MARMSSTSSLDPRKIGERTWSPVGSISKIGLVPSVAFPPAFSTMYAWNVWISKLVSRFSKNFSIQLLLQKFNQIVDISKIIYNKLMGSKWSNLKTTNSKSMNFLIDVYHDFFFNWQIEKKMLWTDKKFVFFFNYLKQT